MDFHTMKRKELQALCKKHKIPANLTNLEMADRLASLLKIEEKPKEQQEKSCLKSLDDLGATDDKTFVVKQVKKVRFSPENQTFEFEKTNPREMRLAARRRKSILTVEGKTHSGEKVSALENPGTSQQRASESEDVDNRVKSTTARGRGGGRKTEQAGALKAQLLKKKQAEEDDRSKKTSKEQNTCSLVGHEGQSLVDTREKARKNTATEAKRVPRRSARNVARDDDFASLTKDVNIVELPKRKTRSDCLKNQHLEKASPRCSRKSTLKEAHEEAVDKKKEEMNLKARVARNTQQKKKVNGLNETVSALKGASIVQQLQQRRSTRVATKRDLVAPQVVNGNRKSGGQSRCPGKEKSSTMNPIEDLQTDVEGASLTKSVISDKGGDQNRLYNDSNATEENQDKNQSLHQTTTTVKLQECESTNAEEGSCKANTDFDELAERVVSKEKAHLTNKSSTDKSVSLKEKQPGNALLISSEEGILLDLYSSGGQITKDDYKAVDADKQEVYEESENLNGDPSEDAEIVLLPSNGLKSSPLRVASIVSRTSTENSKMDLDSSVQCDPPSSSISIDKLTGISLPVCTPDYQGQIKPQYEAATLILLLEEYDSNNAAGEGSSIKNTEWEDHIQDAEAVMTSNVDSITTEEKESGDALLISSEEGLILDLYNLKGQITQDEEITDYKSYPVLVEFQSVLVAGDDVESNGHAAEGFTPTAMLDENPQGIDTFVSDRSDDTGGSEGSPKQGPVTEGKDSVAIVNDLEGLNRTEVSDVQLNNIYEDAVLADQNLEVHEEEGESCRETDEVSDRLNDAIICMEDAVLTGRNESSISNDLVYSDIDGDSTIKVHKISPSSSYNFNNKLELVSGLKEHKELTYADDRNFEITRQQDELFRDEAGKLGHQTLENGSTEIYDCGYPEDKMLTIEKADDEQTSMHACGYRNYSASDAWVSSEDELKEQKDAVTLDVHSLAPCQHEHADASSIMRHNLTREVAGKIACLVEDDMAAASEAIQNGIAPNCYSPEPEPVDVSRLMYQEEDESSTRNEAAPDVLEGSEEELVLLRSVEEANAADENANFDESRATIEVTAPSSEALCLGEELYSSEHTQSEEDFLGHGIHDRAERTGEQDESCELSCEIVRSPNDGELHDTVDEENFSLTAEPEDDDKKEHKEADIHNGDSSEDAENMLPCSGGLKDSPLKEVGGLTPTAQVNQTFEGVDSLISDRVDDVAISEGSHKQGLIKESNLQLPGHENTYCDNLERKLDLCLAEESTQRQAVHENSESRDFELTSYETALFMGDDNFSDEAEELDSWTSERSLLASMMDGSDKKEGKIDMEQGSGDLDIKQGSDSSEFTVLKSLVCDNDDSMQKKYAAPTGHLFEPSLAKHEDVSHPENCKAFEEDTGIVECVLEDEKDSINQSKESIFEELMKDDEILLCSMDEICTTAEMLEGDNKEMEAHVAASIPEISSVTPDGITKEDIFESPKQEFLVRSAGEANPTAENMEDYHLEQLYAPSPERSSPVEEVDHTGHTCAAEVVHTHENWENKDCELARWETYEAGDLNHMTSETGLLTSEKDARDIQEGIVSIEQVGDEQINKQGCDFRGSDVLSSVVCHKDASKLQEVAGPDSHSPETCQVEHEDISRLEHCTTHEEVSKKVDLCATPDVFHEDMAKVENEGTCHPEHLEDENASVDAPMADIFQDLKEDEVLISSVEEIRSTVENPECCNGESGVQLTVPLPEMRATILDDEHKTSDVEGISKEDEMMPQLEMKPLNDDISEAEMPEVNMSSRKPTSLMNHKKRSILMHGTPRRPNKTADMKENNTAHVKREHLANATALRPLARRKALGEIHGR